ncbi:zinc finger family protein [Kwoniella heveanensis CBS 569]|nr:zinc finger family protein [Kwoniella heveanensis CBS 569]
MPYSTRTISSLGHNSRLSVDPTDSLSPPPSYGHFSNSSSSRRNSKYTAFSGSSGSSIHSYSTTDSSSYRGHNQHWHLGERPDISTVFEENSGDADADPEYEEDEHVHDSNKDQYEFGVPLKSREHSASGDSRYPTLHTQTSSNTLVNRPSSRSTPGYFSRERSSTINSANGTITSTGSGKSTSKPVHPFANAVVRPTSPPPLPSSKSHNNFLSPQHPRRPSSPTLQSSRSSPNLAESYKMSNQPTHQVTLVSTEDDRDDEETCPVCVESLSFTYRLPGEKPHIVPECGHALHEECFVTVYGDVPPEGSKKVLGVCGVCRQPMKMADGATKRDKLAMLMGQPGQNAGRKPSQSAPSVRSTSGRGQPSSLLPVDPNADDPLEDRTISSSRSMHSEGSQPKVVVPSISIRSEFPSIAKGHRKGKQVITAMVTVEVPPAENKGRYPPKARPNGMSRTASHEDQFSPQLPPSPRSASDSSVVPSTARSAPASASTPDPFAHVVYDLRHRVVDYKTSGLDQLGSLKLFDLLCVRKGQLIREFHVYLFQEALICVSEEKKSGLRGIFSSSASIRSDHSSGSHHGRGVLKLKGRIYVRHVRKVIDTSVPGELSLTITMEDESLDSFILCFKDRSSHETWRSTINRLLEDVKGGSQNKVQKMMGSAAPRSANASSSANGSALGMSFGDLASPSTAGFAVTPASSTFTHTEPTPGDLAYEQPLAPIHTPIDLVIVLSLPAPSSNSQLPLKVKLMKSSLSFILALLGPKDRISLVTCEMGVNGLVRKTPFLSPCRYESRKRLEAFVETLGTGRTAKDEFEASVGREERFDVVTAVNVALDVVLQRKVKNPISGMVLISDTSDVIKRAQMDLVTARLDAANVPVHALGYGRSHDPSPLWMISNHTHGTYTFVKEWYHLRDSLAGVVGGLMAIAMDNMKLHLSCQENDFHVTKVSGTTSAIVSKNGKDVDIELRELRHGEIREILVELDLESGRLSERRADGSQNGSSIRKAPSFNVDRGLGLDTLSVGDANALRDVVYEDALIDEVPVVEVDCCFHDPGAGRSVARLAHPVLLTVAILPSNAPPSSSPADPMIVRRRMELLASDMITRALLIASRKNFTHASRILRETKRIIETIVDGLRAHVSQQHVNGNGQGGRSKREAQTLFAVEGLMGTVQDLDMLLDGLEEHKEMFERDHRNYSAQQAGVLRAQRSWTTRTPTERTYATKEVQYIIALSGEWQGRV